MEQLKKLDKVAYIRFASVYRSFEDVRDFCEEIANYKINHSLRDYLKNNDK